MNNELENKDSILYPSYELDFIEDYFINCVKSIEHSKEDLFDYYRVQYNLNINNSEVECEQYIANMLFRRNVALVETKYNLLKLKEIVPNENQELTMMQLVDASKYDFRYNKKVLETMELNHHLLNMVVVNDRETLWGRETDLDIYREQLIIAQEKNEEGELKALVNQKEILKESALTYNTMFEYSELVKIVNEQRHGKLLIRK